MKKIALLHYAYPPNIGGVEILLREQANILSKLGHHITVITGNGKEENPKINLIEIPEIQSILKFNPPLYEKIVEDGIVDEDFYSLAKTIEDKITKYLDKQDTIIVHNMATLIHNLPFVYFLKNYLNKNPQKKIIIWTHDQTFINGEKILSEKPGVNLNQKAKDLLLNPVKNATYVVISETLKTLITQIMDLSNNTVIVISNGIDIKKFLEIDDSIWNIVEKNNLLESYPLILSPVNILERKNLIYAVEIIAYLKKAYPKIKYIISGQVSNHRKNLDYLKILYKKINELNLKDNVIFIKDFYNRSLENKEIHDLYQLSDIVFFFSKAENFGLPLIEAALTKTPIFVSDLKVFREISRDNLLYADSPQTIQKYLEENKLTKLYKIAKQQYNLKSIIKEKLIPLL